MEWQRLGGVLVKGGVGVTCDGCCGCFCLLWVGKGLKVLICSFMSSFLWARFSEASHHDGLRYSQSRPKCSQPLQSYGMCQYALLVAKTWGFVTYGVSFVALLPSQPTGVATIARPAMDLVALFPFFPNSHRLIRFTMPANRLWLALKGTSLGSLRLAWGHFYFFAPQILK